jgi:S1-C subfamily serine protease
MAAFRLYEMFRGGRGVKRDDVMGESWLRRSIELGYVVGKDLPPRFGSTEKLPAPGCYTGSMPAVPKPEPERYVMVSSGSGFYVNELELVTNHHVIDDCDRVTVEKESGPVSARVIAVDAKRDLAVLRTEAPHTSHARLRQDPGVLGEPVYLFGYPQRPLLASINMTNGIVSSLTGFRGDRSELQTTAAVQKGNSGGPLVDAEGAVIGVITSILRDSQNVGFAVKNTALVDFLEDHKVTVTYADPDLDPRLQAVSAGSASAPRVAREVQDFTFPIACHAKR